jgi:hypothetical protein
MEYYIPPNVNTEDYVDIDVNIENIIENTVEDVIQDETDIINNAIGVLDDQVDEIKTFNQDLYQKTQFLHCDNQKCYFIDQNGNPVDVYANKFKRKKISTLPRLKEYEQCGGQDFETQQICDEGLFCKKQNKWYSSCRKN